MTFCVQNPNFVFNRCALSVQIMNFIVLQAMEKLRWARLHRANKRKLIRTSKGREAGRDRGKLWIKFKIQDMKRTLISRKFKKFKILLR